MGGPPIFTRYPTLKWPLEIIFFSPQEPIFPPHSPHSPTAQSACKRTYCPPLGLSSAPCENRADPWFSLGIRPRSHRRRHYFSHLKNRFCHPTAHAQRPPSSARDAHIAHHQAYPAHHVRNGRTHNFHLVRDLEADPRDHNFSPQEHSHQHPHPHSPTVQQRPRRAYSPPPGLSSALGKNRADPSFSPPTSPQIPLENSPSAPGQHLPSAPSRGPPAPRSPRALPQSTPEIHACTPILPQFGDLRAGARWMWSSVFKNRQRDAVRSKKKKLHPS
jgi:hypothetical protein